MTRIRTNKTIAGFHLLMILSAVDFKLSHKEDLVIRDYIIQEFPFRLNMDREIEILSGLGPEMWESHFLQCMEDFYADSTEEERLDLLQFAINLCKADDVITREENRFLNMLFHTWYQEARD